MSLGCPIQPDGDAGLGYSTAMAEDFGDLLPGEELVVEAHPHWWYFAKEIISGLIILGVLILLLVVFEVSLDWAGPIIAIAILVWLVAAGIRYAAWRRTEFIVTTRRVAYHSGLLHRTGVSIPLDRINNVNYSQTFIERVFSSGDLLIESAGESGDTVFHNIPNPQGAQHLVYEQIEAYAQRDAVRDANAVADALRAQQVASAPAATSVAAQIEELGRLRDAGLITQAEFDQIKSKALAG